MEKDSGFGFHRYLHPLSTNTNLMDFRSDTVHMNTEPVCKNPRSVGNSTSRAVPFFPVSGLQQSKASEPNNSLNWFYGMPHCHPAFAPVLLNSAPKEKFPANLFDFGQHRIQTMATPPAQKRFLVFDQSGDKTTLIYSSGVQNPVQFGARWAPNHHDTYKEEPKDSICPLRPSENLEDNSRRDDTEDEMHEDTEELNALLFSDDDSDVSKDDEETSTGHSPSTMTDNGMHDLAEEIGEEVDSSFAGPTKRQKLLDGSYDIPSNRRTGSSLKKFAHSGLEDDAESSCGNGNKRHHKEELGSWSGGKRSRKENIRETLSILQSIIPNVNGKDAVVVIDEAIRYLRSLKVKAMDLGLDAL